MSRRPIRNPSERAKTKELRQEWAKLANWARRVGNQPASEHRSKLDDPIVIATNEQQGTLDIKVSLAWLRAIQDEILEGNRASALRVLQRAALEHGAGGVIDGPEDEPTHQLLNQWEAAHRSYMDRTLTGLLNPFMAIALGESVALCGAEAWRIFEDEQLRLLPTMEGVDGILAEYQAIRRQCFEKATPNRRTPYMWRHGEIVEAWAALVQTHQVFWKWVGAFHSRHQGKSKEERLDLLAKDPEFTKRAKEASIKAPEELIAQAADKGGQPLRTACESARRTLGLEEMTVGAMMNKYYATIKGRGRPKKPLSSMCG